MDPPLKVSIGTRVVVGSNKVRLDGRVIGKMAEFDIVNGLLAVEPNGECSFLAFATALAMADFSAGYHVVGGFWANSYKKDGEWYAEYFDGDHIQTQRITGNNEISETTRD
jgi:hypothetical protein